MTSGGVREGNLGGFEAGFSTGCWDSGLVWDPSLGMWDEGEEEEEEQDRSSWWG